MKSLIFILTAVACIAPIGFSQDKGTQEPKPIVITIGGGLYFDAMPQSNGSSDPLSALLNFRGEVYGGVHFKLADMILVGGEVGFAAMTTSFTFGNATFSGTLIDIPVRIVGGVDLSFITLQPYLGGLFRITNFSLGSTSSTEFTPAFEAGARLLIGKVSGFYAEIGMVLGSISYPRLGVGFQLAL